MDKTNMGDAGKITTLRTRIGPDTTGAALADWRRRLDFLYETVAQSDATAAFWVDGSTTQLARACLVESAGSGQQMIRSDAYAAHAPVDQLAFFRLVSGRVIANYQGREAVLEPGDLVAMDYQRAQSSKSTDFRCAMVTVPRDIAPPRFRGGDLHGVRIAAASPAGQLLGCHFDALFGLLTELSFEEADAAVAALLTLAAAVWPEPEPNDEVRTDGLLDRAMAFVDAHLSDPDLRPAELCEMLGIGRTTLYRVFASAGGVSAAILKRKLEASVLALVRHDPRPGLVATIAQDCGFRSSTHFVRTFRERYGRTPGEVAVMRSTDVGGGLLKDWFGARAREAGYDTIALWLSAKEI